MLKVFIVCDCGKDDNIAIQIVPNEGVIFKCNNCGERKFMGHNHNFAKANESVGGKN